MQPYVEVQNTDPEQHQRWLEKHGFQPDAEGKFRVDEFQGKLPVETEQLFDNIRVNVSSGWYEPLYSMPYDHRTFVMICGGPSLLEHLDEIRAKVARPEEYLVVTSNMTAGWLLSQGIKPHVHFIIDPQEKKRFDVAPDKTSPDVQYWINAACHPTVFATLREQGIKPYIFLADFDADGRAVKAVQESMLPGQPGMMAVQGGTMAGLRAMNLAEALGFRKMEYYGFDATVRISGNRAAPYAYEKKRGEAIIEIQCDRCPQTFDTTLIFQRQVNEFISWRARMPWLDVSIIGGGLIAHYLEHLKADDARTYHSDKLFTEEYAAMQRQMHADGGYGVTGAMYTPTIFHAICQLAKRLGPVSMLDYGSARGDTFKALMERFWLPPDVVAMCYDPFVAGQDKAMPANLVVCTDVMEHVEPECTRAVLDHIKQLTKNVVFFSIALTPANKKLPDGRNAHINLRTAEAWLRELKRRFILSEVQVSKDGDALLAVGQSIQDVDNIMRSQRGQSA